VGGGGGQTEQGGLEVGFGLVPAGVGLGAEADFSLITVDTNNPTWTAPRRSCRTRPNCANIVRYNDLPVGDWSDVISVTAQA